MLQSKGILVQIEQLLIIIRVKIDDAGVNTTDFIGAAESLVRLFDLLGSSAFAIVQKDMTGNIEKIRARQTAFPAQCDTLEGLVKGEAVEKKRTATEGLMWLLRCASFSYRNIGKLIANSGLAFTVAALRRSLNNPTEELADSFTKAYNETLKKFHSFVIRPVFAVSSPRGYEFLYFV